MGASKRDCKQRLRTVQKPPQKSKRCYNKRHALASTPPPFQKILPKSSSPQNPFPTPPQAYASKRAALEGGDPRGGRWAPLWDRLVFSKVRAKLGGEVKLMTSGEAGWGAKRAGGEREGRGAEGTRSEMQQHPTEMAPDRTTPPKGNPSPDKPPRPAPPPSPPNQNPNQARPP